ncbi:protein of unknown function [Cupriavidus taiwanensis]|nr:hypothetical protein CBM2606_A90290 [Cupriavidus taiwanensis]SPA41757.1 protein of unknown function [Cupriavidus taiwanensis]
MRHSDAASAAISACIRVNPHIQYGALSLHCPDWRQASVMQGETVAAPAAHGAEGATAPETLRQKDRHHPSVHSEECRTPSSARHTEGASAPAPVARRRESLRSRTEGASYTHVACGLPPFDVPGSCRS